MCPPTPTLDATWQVHESPRRCPACYNAHNSRKREGVIRVPTILQVGPYRVFFYSNEGSEPPHVHVEAGDNLAKFWLAPVRAARQGGFSDREVRKIVRILEEHQDQLEKAWHDYFGS